MCLPFNPAIPLLAIFPEDKLQEIQNNTAEGYSMKYCHTKQLKTIQISFRSDR